jgi:hypothetical protein
MNGCRLSPISHARAGVASPQDWPTPAEEYFREWALSGKARLSERAGGGCGSEVAGVGWSRQTPTMEDLGPAGFTLEDDVRAILEPFADRERGGARALMGLDAEAATRLLEVLPAAVVDDSHQGAPSLREASRIITQHGGTLGGYWVLPPRTDERVSVDSITVPRAAVSAVVRALAEKPDERVRVGDGMVRLWWD